MCSAIGDINVDDNVIDDDDRSFTVMFFTFGIFLYKRSSKFKRILKTQKIFLFSYEIITRVPQVICLLITSLYQTIFKRTTISFKTSLFH